MSVYIVAQLRFKDKSRYRAYQSEFGKIFAQSKGRLLAADEMPEIMEGEWERDKVVLMEFQSGNEAREFLSSPDYLRISENRRAGADTIALLVHGFRK